ncbi:MAG: Nif3-like dinuclear metal center hexameric protein [Synergistaceae bacterium]|nr:Nif3-like dinuclear metal center hexameric protein [Synergistaceae bacterium]
MLVKDLLRKIDGAIPFEWAEEWDNSGLLVGSPRSPVSGIALSLDPDLESLNFALAKGCSVLVSHHPLLFSPVRRIDTSFGAGECIAFAMKNDIAVIAVHTNWDSAPSGVNAVLAAALGLEELLPLVPSDRGARGMGAAGKLSSPVRCLELGQKIRETLNLSRLNFYGDPERPVERLALCGGSGAALWPEALNSGADAFFTSDVKYHERLEALGRGLNLFVADHGEAESFSLDALAETLSAASGREVLVYRPHRPYPLVFD